MHEIPLFRTLSLVSWCSQKRGSVLIYTDTFHSLFRWMWVSSRGEVHHDTNLDLVSISPYVLNFLSCIFVVGWIKIFSTHFWSYITTLLECCSFHTCTLGYCLGNGYNYLLEAVIKNTGHAHNCRATSGVVQHLASLFVGDCKYGPSHWLWMCAQLWCFLTYQF